MRLLTLTINNFLSFESAKLNLDKTGLVAVQGKNLDGNGADSNGSGKSSLFIAIRWCLYGNIEKEVAADDVVNSKAGKNCLVETVWLDDRTGIKYRVTRYRKHSKHKNKLTFELQHPGYDWQNETLGKNDLTQAFVNLAVGMDDTVFMASCFASQEDPIDIPAMKDSELKRLLEDSLPFAKFDPLHQKYKLKLEFLTKELKKAETAKRDGEHSYNVNRELHIRASDEQRLYLAKHSAERSTAIKNLGDLKNKLDGLVGSLPDISALEASRKALQARYDGLGVADAALVTMRLEAAVRALALAKSKKSKGSMACPTCDAPFSKEKREVYDKAVQSEIDTARENVESLYDRLEDIKNTAPLADKIQEALVQITAKQEAAGYVRMDIERVKGQMQVEAMTIRRLESDPYEGSIKMLDENLVKDTACIMEANKSIKELEPEIATYANLVDATSPKGFRYHMLESITPELNKATNYYLSMLTDGKIGATWSTVTRLGSGEFKEAFSIKVNMNGRTSFGALSGGQKKKVRLACWFALQDMIAQRAEKEVKLWVCDEVDGALDKAGIERLMSLLEEKARTKETVLVISHNNLKDWIANNIVVSMKDDVSVVNGFLNVD